MFDREGLCSDRLQLDAVDEGFSKGDIFDTGKVKTVNVVPDCEGSERIASRSMSHN